MNKLQYDIYGENNNKTIIILHENYIYLNSLYPLLLLLSKEFKIYHLYIRGIKKKLSFKETLKYIILFLNENNIKDAHFITFNEMCKVPIYLNKETDIEIKECVFFNPNVFSKFTKWWYLFKLDIVCFMNSTEQKNRRKYKNYKRNYIKVDKYIKDINIPILSIIDKYNEDTSIDADILEEKVKGSISVKYKEYIKYVYITYLNDTYADIRSFFDKER